MRIFNLFRRKTFKPEPKSLRIDGIKTVLTPEPDDAELAAQALLESRIYGDRVQRRDGRRKKEEGKKKISNSQILDEPPHDAEYYRGLSEKIRTAHEQERRAAMRYVAYVEEQLKLVQGSLQSKAAEPSAGFRVQDSGLRVNGSAQQDSSLFTLHSSLSGIERGLYAHQACVEREGGDLLKRWQHCLAECIVREMNGSTEDAEETETTETTTD